MGRRYRWLQKKNPTKVKLLNDHECQRADHECQGVWHCNQINPDLLRNCERYKPDPNQRRGLWEAELKVNDLEGETMHGVAAMYVRHV